MVWPVSKLSNHGDSMAVRELEEFMPAPTTNTVPEVDELVNVS